MNPILQKRIEEAARYIAELCPDCDLHCKGPNPCIPKIIYGKLIEMATFALQSQWISVEKALPKANELVFGCVNDEGVPQSVGMVYYDEYGGWHYSDEEEISLITNWMPIPSLEGGEK